MKTARQLVFDALATYVMYLHMVDIRFMCFIMRLIVLCIRPWRKERRKRLAGHALLQSLSYLREENDISQKNSQ